jgi:outer membrane protein assembly factor BamB
MDDEDMLFSGGWPGQLQRTLEALIGEDVTALYFNGAEGDQSPVPPESAASNWERAEHYGREIGIHAWRTFQSIQPKAQVRLAFDTEQISLPKRTWHPDFLKTGGAEYGLDETMMQGFVDLLLPYETHSTALTIGDLQILGVRGEMTAELGLLLKSRVQQRQPNLKVVVAGLADEWISYILSPDEYRRGGYEASMSYYGAQLGTTLLDGALRAASGRARTASGSDAAVMNADPGVAQWPQFRGPGGSGVADGNALPIAFGPETNLLWKTQLPPGQSSPCIWDSRLFITAADDDALLTLCLDAHSGEELWRRTLPLGEGERGSGLGGPAAPTCCTDGQRVYAYSGPFGIAAFTLDGQEVWRRPLPTPVTSHGVGSSPVLAGNIVILLRDQDADSHLLALDAQTGETVWRTARPEFRRGFSTPLVVRDAQDSIIVAPGTLQVVAYKAADGRELWRASGLPNEVCSSPVGGPELILVGGWTPGSGVPRMPDFDSLLVRGDANEDHRLERAEAPGGPSRQHFHYIDSNRDGVLTREEYEFIADAFNRSRNALLAIEPGGQGDVTTSHMLWTQTRGLPYVPTPLLYHGRVYLVKNGGMLTCLDATTGAFLYREERLNVLGDNYASPVASDGRIYVASRSGTVAVVQEGESLQVLARNSIGESILATPAIAHKTLYVRTEKHLWAFRGE